MALIFLAFLAGAGVAAVGPTPAGSGVARSVAASGLLRRLNGQRHALARSGLAGASSRPIAVRMMRGPTSPINSAKTARIGDHGVGHRLHRVVAEIHELADHLGQTRGLGVNCLWDRGRTWRARSSRPLMSASRCSAFSVTARLLSAVLRAASASRSSFSRSRQKVPLPPVTHPRGIWPPHPPQACPR